MTKYGKKRQILYQLFNAGYTPNNAQKYLKSTEGIAKYGQVNIGRPYFYASYKRWQKRGIIDATHGTVTPGSDTGVEQKAGEKEPLTAAPSPQQPLKIDVTGSETPLQQLQYIGAGGPAQVGVDGKPVPQLMQGDQLKGLFTSVKENYPKQYQWSNEADALLGNVWAPIVNRWITASSENFLLGFAVVCTIFIVARPTILTVRDWMEERKRREKPSPMKKRAEKALEQK